MELEFKFISQGDVVVSDRPVMFKTVLGSCISICLWDKRTGRGGMNHYNTPVCYRNDTVQNMCGEYAIANLIKSMLKKGSKLKDIEAHVYGGGRTIETSDSFQIGKRNAEIAFEVLREHGIRVKSSDTEHSHGLKILFDTSKGEIECLRVGKTAARVKPRIKSAKEKGAISDFQKNLDKMWQEFNHTMGGDNG